VRHGSVRTRSEARSTKAGGRAHGRWRAATATAAVTLLAVLTAACGGNSAPAAQASAAPAGSAAPPASSAATAPPTGDTDAPAGSPSSSATASPPATTATGGAAAASPRCTTDDLRLSLGRPDPGAGNIRYTLQFTDTGPDGCALRGFPGVSLLAGDGSTIGSPATREGPQLEEVDLAPGGSARVTLHTLNKGIKGPGCRPAPSLLKVYPPGSRDALTLRTSLPVVCGNTFTVTSVTR
jgi:hypothetical protein